MESLDELRKKALCNLKKGHIKEAIIDIKRIISVLYMFHKKEEADVFRMTLNQLIMDENIIEEQNEPDTLGDIN